MIQQIGYVVLIAVDAFLTWATGMAVRDNHDLVALMFFALFATFLTGIIIIWFCETCKPFRSSVTTIKGE